MMDALHWPDWLILLTLAASAVVGLMRGLVFEVLSVVSWVVAWVGAQWWAGSVGAWMGLGESGTLVPRTVGFGAVFIGLLVLCRLLTWLIQQIVQATPLVVLDRLFGTAFGLLRGGVMVLAGVLVLGVTPLARQEGWADSAGVRWSRAVLAVVAPSWSSSEPST